MRQILVFRAGNGVFGVDLPQVANIRKAAVDGRGGPRLAHLLNLDDGGDASDSDQVVTLAGDGASLSLRVDRIDGVVNAHEGEILPLPPAFGEMAQRHFPRVLMGEQGLVLMLDPAALAAVADESPGPEAPAAAFETASKPAEMSDADLEDRLLELVSTAPMTRRIEAMIHSMAENTAERGLSRIRQALKRT